MNQPAKRQWGIALWHVYAPRCLFIRYWHVGPLVLWKEVR